jgi:hypothetical protein
MRIFLVCLVAYCRFAQNRKCGSLESDKKDVARCRFQPRHDLQKRKSWTIHQSDQAEKESQQGHGLG